MRDQPVGNIIRGVSALQPHDTVARAQEALRSSQLTELPVVSGARLVGMISESFILSALVVEDADIVLASPVSTVMSETVVSANPYMTVIQTAEVMRDHDKHVLPVLDPYGAYLGVVTRSDISGALCLTMRPPTIAGLATPLGVYLTTGHVRAGVGELGLILTGAVLMLINVAAFWFVFGVALLLDKTGLFAPLSLYRILIFPGTAMVGSWHVGEIVRYAMLAIALPAFFILLRLLPISGYHAAEHQVVHAIENGEPLKPENVRAMPRVHQRCGTNIFAAVLAFMIITEIFSTQTAVLIAIFVLIFAWRVIGGYFQYYVTTKPPSDRQLQNGIDAGKELLAKYRQMPAYRVTGPRRIWNTGLPQVMIGAVGTMLAVQLLGLTPPMLL